MVNNDLINFVLLGKTGAGKSAAGNTILGRPAFISKKSSNSITQDVSVESGSVCGHQVNVYDTPGFCDTQMSDQKIQEKFNNVLQDCQSKSCVFLLVMKADRFTAEEQNTVKKIEKLLGQNRIQQTWILFTRGDELEDENMTIDDFIKDTEPLKKLIQKYVGRYHVINNKKKTSDQVQMLLNKVSKLYNKFNQKVSGGVKKLKEIPGKIHESLPHRRVVLLGKSGVGKSRTGNTILGKKAFKSELNTNSVTTKCLKKRADVEGRTVSVFDTPGFFDTQMSVEMLIPEIGRSVLVSSPGPHAFLIVFPVNMRFTEQEQLIAEQTKALFGEDVLKYSIILFTHGDLLKERSIEKLIEVNSALRDLVKQCGGRYHVFNNKDERNRDQVRDLMMKIDTMIEKNGGGHYTCEMFEEVQRLKEERQRNEEEIQRETDEQKKKEKQEELERERRKIEEEYELKLAELKAELETNKDKSQKKDENKQAEDGGQTNKNEEKKEKQDNKADLQTEPERVKEEGQKRENKDKLTIFQWFKNNWKIILAFTVMGALGGGLVGALGGGLVGALGGGAVGCGAGWLLDKNC